MKVQPVFTCDELALISKGLYLVSTHFNDADSNMMFDIRNKIDAIMNINNL